MKTKHTPGPWIFAYGSVYQGDQAETVEGFAGRIATMDRDNPHTQPTERDANARLIAAAPELLEACKEAQKLIELARPYFPKSMHHSDKFALENANATIGKAIAKATSFVAMPILSPKRTQKSGREGAMKPTELVVMRNAKGQYLSAHAYNLWEQGKNFERVWTDNRDEAAVFPAEDAPPVGEGMKLESAYE